MGVRKELKESAVGVRELKNKLSAYLEIVKAGRPLTITERGKAVATLSPAGRAREYEGLFRLLQEGLAGWAGGKPRGPERVVRVSGKRISQIVIEERR